MKKLIISTAFGLVMALPLALLSGTANAREGVRGGQAGDGEVIQHDGAASAGDNNGALDGGVQQGIVEHPVADVDAVRRARENADNNNNDDNAGVPDENEGASSAQGAQ